MAFQRQPDFFQPLLHKISLGGTGEQFGYKIIGSPGMILPDTFIAAQLRSNHRAKNIKKANIQRCDLTTVFKS